MTLSEDAATSTERQGLNRLTYLTEQLYRLHMPVWCRALIQLFFRSANVSTVGLHVFTSNMVTINNKSGGNNPAILSRKNCGYNIV